MKVDHCERATMYQDWEPVVSHSRRHTVLCKAAQDDVRLYCAGQYKMTTYCTGGGDFLKRYMLGRQKSIMWLIVSMNSV